MIVTGLVLMIACANVANLLSSRAASRRQELSMRLALGARPERIIRQLLTESMLIALLGGALGLILAHWGTKILLLRFVTGNVYVDSRPDIAIIGFNAGIILLSGFASALLPSIRGSREDVIALMKRDEIRGGGRLGFGDSSLVVFQVAVCLPLLVAAGLFLRTLQNLAAQDLGFEKAHILLVGIDVRFSGINSEDLPSVYRSVTDRIQNLPGVHSVSSDGSSPFSGNNSFGNISVEGYVPHPLESMDVHIDIVRSPLFETLGIPIVNGRDLSDNDGPSSPRVAVINEAMARRFFPGGNPIGRRFSKGAPFDPSIACEIVGIARNARYYSLRDDVPPMVFLAQYQQLIKPNHELEILVRAAGGVSGIDNGFADRSQRWQPLCWWGESALLATKLMNRWGRAGISRGLSFIFGSLAVVLACAGLYGTMAYRIACRRNEFGVRMALGANRRNVLWLVQRECLFLMTIGCRHRISNLLLVDASCCKSTFRVIAARSLHHCVRGGSVDRSNWSCGSYSGISG